MKRILIILLTLALLISGLAVSVSATEESTTSALQPVYDDYLLYPYFNILDPNGNTTQSAIPMFSAKVDGEYKLTWGDGLYRFSPDYVLISISASVLPESVYFFTFAGQLYGISDNVYFYKFDTQGQRFLDLFNVRISMPSDFTSTVEIVSFFGVTDDTYLFDEVNLYSYGYLSNATDGSYYQEEFYNSAVVLPKTYIEYFNSDSPSVSPESFYVNVNTPLSVPIASSLSLTFVSTGVWPNYYDGAVLTDGGFSITRDGETVEVLPYYVSSCASTGASYNGLPLWKYTLTVDLSGIDLSNAFIHFTTQVKPRYPVSGSVVHTVYFQILSVGLKNKDHIIPWYQRFFYWIKAEFDEIDAKLNSIFQPSSSPPDISDQQQDIDDSVGDMDQIGDDFENSRNELEILTPEVPNWEDTGLDGFDDIVGARIAVIRNVFLTIYANDIINQIITYTFLFALGGFILFGER